MPVPVARTVHYYQSARYDIMQRHWAEFMYFEFIDWDLRKCKVCPFSEFKDRHFTGSPQLDTKRCYDCILTSQPQAEVWIESSYDENEINGAQREYEWIYSAPSRCGTDQFKAGDICPNCLEGKLEPTQEEFTMPYTVPFAAIPNNHVKAELKCPECKSYYWRSQ